MPKHSSRKERVRAYAEQHQISYTAALRALYPDEPVAVDPHLEPGDSQLDQAVQRLLTRMTDTLDDQGDEPDLDLFPVKAPSERRTCLWVDETCWTPNGYVPALVVEDEAGYTPMMGRGEHAQPWYFGRDIDTARKLVAESNAERGLSEQDVDDIVVSSMRAQSRAEAAARRWNGLRSGL